MPPPVLCLAHPQTSPSTNQWACNKRGGVESCAISTYSLYLFIQFLSQKSLHWLTQYDQSPTCPKPEPRVATRPLPRPLYFWYLLVQFETYIVVTVYCPCESIKHQVVETCFCRNPSNPIQSSDGGSNTIVLEHRATNSSIGQRFAKTSFWSVSVWQRSRLRETFCLSAREQANCGAHDQSVCCEALAFPSSWDVESHQCLTTPKYWRISCSFINFCLAYIISSRLIAYFWQ